MSDLPKIIWMYWDQGKEHMPPLVEACVESWQLNHSDWDVRVLSKDTIQSYVDINAFSARSDIGIQSFSDILRLQLLAQHGGVWADATLFCVRPLDSWLPEYMQDDFFGFQSIKQDRWITNWFLAANPQSALLQSWLRAMISYWGNHYFKEMTYAKKQLVRRLTSLRRRSLLSNNIWFSSLFTKWLKVYPYPVSMYLFERALEHDGLSENWHQRNHLKDDLPEYLQNVLRLGSEVSDESMQFVRSCKTPMHKLNWRLGENLSNPKSNLYYLINSFKDNKL